jgi:methyltransferase (TIGR00027 family)
VKINRPSVTAAWVAAARGLSNELVSDPYGTRFAPRLARFVIPRRARLYMQVRTRVIDDVLLDFVRSGGTQIVLLGAGFDCRALRFARELSHATVFEVDHPATQAKKRDVLRGEIGAKTDYVASNFEERPMSELTLRGLDVERPTLTIWEGVTMYLTERAIDASLRAIRDYSAPGSRLVFNYMERSRLTNPSLRVRIGARVVAAIGETFRFGWDPKELHAYLAERGFTLDRNATMRDWARELLDEEAARATANDRFIAIAHVP